MDMLAGIGDRCIMQRSPIVHPEAGNGLERMDV